MQSARKVILAVDDAQANLQVIQTVLSGEFAVRLAKSGSMAMMALERVTPDLILLDIEMPGMSGFDVMEELKKKERLRSIPIIFVTSHAAPKIVIDAALKGVKDYIVKPFEPELLRSKVYKALGLEYIDEKKADEGSLVCPE
jgi:CheY-like chemotaxis protein